MTSNDVKSLLSNTIIDYTKLTSDDFFYKYIRFDDYAYHDVGYRTYTYALNNPLYNSETGQLSTSTSGGYKLTMSIDKYLCCNIESCLKDNWKDFI